VTPGRRAAINGALWRQYWIAPICRRRLRHPRVIHFRFASARVRSYGCLGISGTYECYCWLPVDCAALTLI